MSLYNNTTIVGSWLLADSLLVNCFCVNFSEQLSSADRMIRFSQLYEVMGRLEGEIFVKKVAVQDLWLEEGAQLPWVFNFLPIFSTLTYQEPKRLSGALL